MKPSDRKSDDGLLVGSGDYAVVWLFGEAKDEYEALQKRNDQTSFREYRTISRYFQRYAAMGPQHLDDTMFKKQDRRSSGGISVMIYEFKAYQFRIYGVVGELKGKRCYRGTACDPKKKKDKADPQKLQKAADEYVRIING
ncbi:hypothetical protein QTL95_14405 [Rhizobium sp. S152]|uniref:hypothetical protein n=1 Tax=Rhizobium sp. S152 TaxID=3055038 RepID=UPI0025AA0DCD|nr:hypothetical protein [Rhizobium sp. S152]MDM9627096.1 hypothetical protein [Rhizobium sp. S152]